ncbi:efflux transporter outer membrane subunit [Pseudomonas abyssi]|uniref:RND transporter n=1 Tax=Pseudomonas abyssi TaxID=170540 RepID=A0A395R1D4_9PSED|nr:efflux transporter outer membrane subunit [Halopseudomonas gallaeciensis]MAG64564.1 RND transporter [Pseudomonadales bacterium]RGP53918.1 RND transporter [Halopseudomonas gallaeciensis]
MYKLLPLALSVMLTACAVGPDYQAPQSVPLASYSQADAAAEQQASEQRFWSGFNDPQLAALVDRALAQNLDVQTLLARYQGAEALLRGARRDRWPSVTLQAAGGERHLAEVERTDPNRERVEQYSVGAVASWELDFYGRLQRAVEAGEADLSASAADLSALQVAIAGQVASGYFTLRGQQQLLAVAEQNVELQQASLDIVSARLDAGRGTEFDRVRAQAELDALRAAVPQRRADVQLSLHRLAVLTGQPPAALNEQLAAPQELPPMNARIPVGTPADVLRRRPDIQAAERRLAAATARIGVATADLFPRFTLGALLGSVVGSDGDLFTAGAESRSVTLGIDWTFLDVEGVRARIAAADATGAERLAHYQQAVLLALEETENGLVRYRHAQERSRWLLASSEAAQAAVDQARLRYEQGYIEYFEVLDAEQQLTGVRSDLVQSRIETATAMVSVYRSLAGAPPVPEA